MKQFDVATVIIMGMFFFLLTFGVLCLCIFTLKKVKNVYKYCEERFDKIESLINISDKNTTELTSLLSKFNSKLQKL